jgi:Ni/Fe-hydrogenase subunit HybB-like protein
MTAITPQKRRIPTGIVILSILTGIGFVVGIIRFARGMGVTTNLNDYYPWGLWISFDVISGVALGSGAFTLAAIVHIFRLDKYRPLLRPAILTGFLGYVLVIIGLLCDLGQPHRLWHIIIYQNFHSPLFEVGMCVMLYTTTLALEVLPFVFERFNKPRIVRTLHMITLPLMVIGITLSICHQSTLGSLFLAMRHKLHPLWHSPILPVFFLLTAIAVGLAMVIFESSLSSKAFRRGLELDLLASLGRAISYILSFYLLLRAGDLILAGDLGLLFEGSFQSNLFILEMVIGVILPIILFALPQVREDPTKLFWSSVLVIVGLVLDRINVSILGMQRPEGVTYFPMWMEFVITVGLISGGLLVFWLAVRYLPIFEPHEKKEPLAGPSAKPKPSTAS